MNGNAAGYSDPGLVRSGNEDGFIVSPELGFFAVADGMGGHNAGEIASSMAIDVLRDYLERAVTGEKKLPEGANNSFSAAANRLAAGIRQANRAIYESAQKNPAWRNMGTTIVAALLENDRLSIAHVGDSRAYMVRGNTIIPLTEDHSLISEQLRSGSISKKAAESSGQRNVITRALGFKMEPEVDLCELLLTPGDRILLCSDGLTNMVREEDILAIVNGSREPADACRQLVTEANRNGGNDNITAVIVMMQSRALSGLSRMLSWARRA